MKYGSVCSGIEAATVAWEPLGWEPVFFSEIEPFPRAVLAHHYPHVPCHGDFTTIKRDDYAAIDVLVGGTPCTSFSLAGLRKGLDSHSGNLALEYVRLLGRLRPTWFVWENVPGVYSSDGGRDFASILGGFTGQRVGVPEGGWQNHGFIQGLESSYSVAWATMDAQWSGVPQRRRRIFVVGCIGADWRRPCAVLLDRTCLSGDPPPRREKGKGIASRFETGPGSYHSSEVSPTLDTRTKNGPMQNQVGVAIVGHGQYSEEANPSLRSKFGDCGGGSEALVVVPTGFRMTAFGEYEDDDTASTLKQRDHKDATDLYNQVGGILGTPTSGGQPPDVAPTLDCSFAEKQGLDDQHINGGAGLFTPVTAGFKQGNSAESHSIGFQEEVSPTLTAGESGTNMVPCVLQPIAFEQNQRDEIRDLHGISDMMKSHEGMKQRTYLAYSVDEECNSNEELHGPLLRGGEGGTRQTIVQVPIWIDGNETGFALRANPSMSGDKGDGGMNTTVVALKEPLNFQSSHGSHVRRLTPKEASRLQGFPDDFAKIPWKGKPADQCPDGPQYKAYGNSMAVPVMAWIGKRIQMVHEILMRRE